MATTAPVANPLVMYMCCLQKWTTCTHKRRTEELPQWFLSHVYVNTTCIKQDYCSGNYCYSFQYMHGIQATKAYKYI